MITASPDLQSGTLEPYGFTIHILSLKLPRKSSSCQFNDWQLDRNYSYIHSSYCLCLFVFTKTMYGTSTLLFIILMHDANFLSGSIQNFTITIFIGCRNCIQHLPIGAC